MAEFKRTQVVDTKASKNLTPDNLYWKRLDFPVTIKHYGFINGLDFSPVVPYNFAVSYSTKVDIYNPDTKRPCAVLTKFKRCAYGGSFRQDGQLFVVGGEDGRVKLFSIKNKLMLRLFKGHESSVHDAKFLFNRQHIVSFSDDKTVRLWDSTTEAQLSLLSGHTDYVRCGAAASQSSDLIASGSYDHTVKFWDLRQAEGQQTCMTMNHGCPIEALLMFPNDSLLLSAGGTNIKIWDLAAGEWWCMRDRSRDEQPNAPLQEMYTVT
uniref:Uncharacterized protein n=1 Tax=Romanomermis culicivorax TaxID=13658 RepID=A0A915KRA5_ROMCU